MHQAGWEVREVVRNVGVDRPPLSPWTSHPSFLRPVSVGARIGFRPSLRGG